MTKIESDIFQINSTIGGVYAFLSDFKRVGAMISVAQQMGQGSKEMAQISDKIDNLQFDEESCSFDVKGLGEMGLKIVEKQEPKLIKMGGDGRVPFDFNLWIQLLENGSYDTRLKITFQADLNVMMKMLLKGKLEKGINQLADGLSKLPYDNIK